MTQDELVKLAKMAKCLEDAAEIEAQSERTAIVGWLRARGNNTIKESNLVSGGQGYTLWCHGVAYHMAADSIERGDHREQQP